MERAARMSARSEGQADAEESGRTGMRLAADYLGLRLEDLGSALNGQASGVQMAVRRAWPRRCFAISSCPVMNPYGHVHAGHAGLLEMEQSAGDMAAICAELKQILEQYNQHKEQIRKQLEDAVRPA